MALALHAERRVASTKGQVRRLRANGKIPGVVYGNGEESVPIVVDEKKLHPILAYHANSILEMNIPNLGTKHVLIKGVQRDPLVGKCEHIDFQFVHMNEEIRAHVRVEFTGESSALKNGIRTVVKDAVEVKCLPSKLPESVKIDISGLDFGEHVSAGQLALPEGVELLTNADEVLLTLAAKQKAADDTAEQEASAAAE